MQGVIEGKNTMKLTDYITEDTVFFSTTGHKKEIIAFVIDKAVSLGLVKDAEAFKFAIEEREAKLSTGIGEGIAIPHARIAGLDEYFILTVILKNSIGWDALDQKPVSMVFLIGGPEDDASTYLKILAKLMGVVKNDEKRAAILNAADQAEVVSFFG